MKRIGLLGLLLCLMSASLRAQEPATPTPFPNQNVFYYFFTYIQPSGNRLLPGQGTFPNVPAYDIQLESVAEWVIGAAIPNDIPRWQVRDALGYTSQVLRPLDADVPGLLTTEERGDPATALPVFVVTPGAAGNLRSQDNPTTLTHPIPLRRGAVYLQVTYNGDAAVWRAEDGVELARLPLNVLRDARPVINREGLIALYAGATTERYVHGVLGDDVEAASLVVLQLSETIFRVLYEVRLDGEDVFEGIAPMWADINSDGVEDLVTTVSNSTQGAQIRAYLLNSEGLLAEVNSPPIGQGGRWRHLIAFGPFGPAGENELASVRTPHIGGALEFLRYNPATNALDVVAEFAGVTSHVIGSRNLDMAVAGDFNGDGQPEVVLPTQDRSQIIAIQHTSEGARALWALPVGGQVVTNLAPAMLPDNTMALALGTNQGRLRLWLPDGTGS